MAYVINDSNKTHKYVNGDVTKDLSIVSVHVENEDVLITLPDEIPVGSLAYMTAFEKVWQKDFDGSWVEVVLQ